MARYMLICRSVEPVPFGDFGDFKIETVGFVRYFATKKEALNRAMKWRCMKAASLGVFEVFAQVFDTKKGVWL